VTPDGGRIAGGHLDPAAMETASRRRLWNRSAREAGGTGAKHARWHLNGRRCGKTPISDARRPRRRPGCNVEIPHIAWFHQPAAIIEVTSASSFGPLHANMHDERGLLRMSNARTGNSWTFRSIIKKYKQKVVAESKQLFLLYIFICMWKINSSSIAIYRQFFFDAVRWAIGRASCL